MTNVDSTVLKQWLRKRMRIFNGVMNSYVNKRGRTYDDSRWWDASFYTEGVSDRQTIGPRKNPITAKYHYASTEMQILLHLRNSGTAVAGASVLDVGSGSGHWIDFYKSLDASPIAGMDVSHVAVEHLKEKYAADPSIDIHQGKALEVMRRLNREFDIVNAIGVMFHIVDDAEWAATVGAIGSIVKKNGLFVAGGHFGLVDGVNMQIDKDGNINKRLRSKRRWIQQLHKAGFTRVQLYRNPGYLRIKDSVPENNVLVATK
jgi:2-polyprenyl-3-methyl-5-hydroxy-6-metoxy-1,4-benzoquinol methylase